MSKDFKEDINKCLNKDHEKDKQLMKTIQDIRV